jgi:N utilization substance protein A
MVSKEFFAALELLEAERNIKKEFFIEALEIALASAFKRQYGEAMDARVKLIPEKNQIKIWSYKTVVADESEDDEDFDYDKMMTLSEAQAIKKTYKIGDVVETEEDPKDFGRVAALTVKQVITGKIRDAQRQQQVDEISARQDQIVTARVTKIDKGLVHLEIPGSNLDGILNEKNQIPGQVHKVDDFLKVYIHKLNPDDRRGDVFVTRTSPQFVRALFDLEVPEIGREEVVVKAIAREAGYRTKICVHSEIPNIDPIGACVGNKGSRIQNILAEITNEKIDIIPWSEDPLEFIASALSPATVLRVEANEAEKTARVIVPNDKLSLAIGKSGMNVRLAARLTGWKIDVKSEEAALKEDINYSEEFTLGGNN